MLILIIGGLNGFVGSNTTEALVELGYDCVVTRHKSAEVPGFLKKHIDQGKVLVEQADATSIADLRKIGEKHKIDGIVNVAGGFKTEGQGSIAGLIGYLDMLNSTLRLAQEWKVNRVTFSSTGGMYLGIPGRVDEKQLISLESLFPLIGYHKIVEVASNEFAKTSGISSICTRITGMFGPNQDPGQFQLVPRLVHAAVNTKTPNLERVFRANTEDSIALFYIKDTARAIAMLQTADKLHYNVYNVGSEKEIPNHELVNAIKKVVPNFEVELPPGHSPYPPSPVMETKRLQQDTGFIPKFDTNSAIQHYVEWLRAGNPK